MKTLFVQPKGQRIPAIMDAVKEPNCFFLAIKISLAWMLLNVIRIGLLSALVEGSLIHDTIELFSSLKPIVLHVILTSALMSSFGIRGTPNTIALQDNSDLRSRSISASCLRTTSITVSVFDERSAKDFFK